MDFRPIGVAIGGKASLGQGHHFTIRIAVLEETSNKAGSRSLVDWLVDSVDWSVASIGENFRFDHTGLKSSVQK